MTSPSLLTSLHFLQRWYLVSNIFSGLGLTNSEKEFMESAVSMPYRETAMFADNTKQLDDIADRIVAFMCDGKS